MKKTAMQLGTEKGVRDVPVIRDGNLIYGLETMRGPATWKDLRGANYGELNGRDFSQITMPQAVRLAYAGLENNVKQVVNTLNEYWLTGNTLIGRDSEGMYGIDMPSNKLAAQLGVNISKVLGKVLREYKSQLGKREEGKVIFSDNGRVRFTPLDKIIFGEQTKAQLARNPGNIVFAGSLENAELNAKSAGRYRSKPEFRGVKYAVKYPLVRSPVLRGSGFDGRLVVDADYFGYYVGWCSFGVLDSGDITKPLRFTAP